MITRPGRLLVDPKDKPLATPAYFQYNAVEAKKLAGRDWEQAPRS